MSLMNLCDHGRLAAREQVKGECGLPTMRTTSPTPTPTPTTSSSYFTPLIHCGAEDLPIQTCRLQKRKSSRCHCWGQRSILSAVLDIRKRKEMHALALGQRGTEASQQTHEVMTFSCMFSVLTT